MTAQSLRLTVAENKLLREAATIERMSINVWGVRTLLAAAKRIIAKNQSTKKVS